MLSLKNSVLTNPRSCKKITDLPREIVDLILEFLFAACGNRVTGVIPVSLACHRLRASAHSILFENVTILADDRGLRAKSHVALQHLLTCVNLLKYVRNLHILTPINEEGRRPSDAAAHYEQSKSLFKAAGQQLTGLKHIRLDHLSNLTIDLLQSVIDNTELRVTLDLQRMDHDGCDRSSYEQCQQLAASCKWTLDIAYPSLKHDFTRRAILEFVLAGHRISALSFNQNSHLLQYLASSGSVLSQLQELYISNTSVETLSVLQSTHQAPWANLRKLQLDGDRQIESLLSYAVEHMQSLTHLRLRARRSTVFHQDCGRNANANSTLINLPWTEIPALRHLELFAICNHLTMAQLTTPKLKSLRIQSNELEARLQDLKVARSPAEITWLAKHVPNLERLELHVGDLENLWHPTAIPGVDVDVEVYQLLQALSKFRHLQQLRLFPQYIPKPLRNVPFTGKQPLSDEQAVRIFRYLKAQQPSLDLLSIIGTFESLYRFSPMAWTVRNTGDKAILTTRQAGKDYEIEQIWVGERRVSMSNKRHTYRQPYLPDLGDWTYQLNRLLTRMTNVEMLLGQDEEDDDPNVNPQEVI